MRCFSFEVNRSARAVPDSSMALVEKRLITSPMKPEVPGRRVASSPPAKWPTSAPPGPARAKPVALLSVLSQPLKLVTMFYPSEVCGRGGDLPVQIGRPETRRKSFVVEFIRNLTVSQFTPTMYPHILSPGVQDQYWINSPTPHIFQNLWS